jgi:hypothetical protein
LPAPRPRRPAGAGWSQAWSEPVTGSVPGSLSVDAAGTVYVPVGARLSAFTWDANASGVHALWSGALPGTSAIAAPAIDGTGRLYVSQGARVQVLDEKPSFKVAYSANGDLFTQREIYGTPLAGWKVQLTNDPDAQSEPAYSRDPGALTWTTDALATLGNGAARAGVPYAASTPASAAALSEIDDLSGRALLPDGRRYVAFTDASTGTPAVRFARLPFGSATLGADDFAGAQGLDPAASASLARPGLATQHAVFSPDGKRVAWVECGGGIGAVVVLELSGTPAVRRFGTPLPEQTGCSGRSPAFSPDSRYLAVESGSGIYGLDLDGVVPFTSAAPSGTRYENPSWAPDGSELAVTRVSGRASDVVTLSGPQYRTAKRLVRGGQDPSYHLSKFPRPLVSGVDRAATPGDEIDVFGRGFDLIRPSANRVFFTHAARSAPVRATVVGTRVDVINGRGVLRVRVPELAGNGPLTVVTAAGVSDTPFTVLPQPLEAAQRRSVPGARIRVFGRGFDLAPAASTRVAFPSAGGTSLYGTVEGGGVDGDREFLVVVVPDGVVDGPISAESNVPGGLGQGHGCGQPACVFTRLHPTVTIRRNDGSPAAYGKQVTSGMTVSVAVHDVPVDPYFGTGRRIDLTVEPWSGPQGMDWKLRFATPAGPSTVLPLPATNGDTVDATAAATYLRSPDPKWDSWGDLDVWLGDASQPCTDPADPDPFGPCTAPYRDLRTRPNGVLRPLARAYLQTPRMNVPVIFVPGTSGTPLNLNAPAPRTYPVAPQVHDFPALCFHCSIVAQGGTVTANPGAVDPQGPRVWAGSELFNPTPGVESLLALCSQMKNCATAGALVSPLTSPICVLVTGAPCPPVFPHKTVSPAVHYSDLLGFTPAGKPVNPEIGISGADPVLRSLSLGPLAPIAGYPLEPIYEDVLSFLTGTPGRGNSAASVDSLGRPLTDARGAAAPRPLGSGPNGVYVFGYDWRDAMPDQADMLNTFITGVLSRPDVASVDTNPARPGIQPIDKAVVLGHSLGATIPRLAYLKRPDLVDQVISVGGGFGGVGMTLKVLAMGDNWGLGKTGFLFDQLADAGWGLAVQPWKTTQLAENWPTAYEQTFNSGRWFDDQGTATTTSARVDRTVISDGGQNVDSFSKLNTYLAGHNPGLAAKAVSDLASVPLDDFRSGTGSVFHYRIVGENVPTHVGARLTTAPRLDCNPGLNVLDPDCWPARVWWQPIDADGDQTIPYKSAVGQSLASDDRVFVLQADGTGRITGPGATTPTACMQAAPRMTSDPSRACHLDHSDLPNFGVSLSLINDLLAGRVGSQPQSAAAGLPFRSHSAVAENFALSTLSAPGPVPAPAAAAAAMRGASLRRPTETETPAPLRLEVRGLVRLKVSDGQGRVLGEKGGIPGAVYEPSTFLGANMTGNAGAQLPEDGAYDVELTAMGATQAELVARHGRSGFSLPPTAVREGTTIAFHVEPDGELPTTVAVTPRDGSSTREPLHALDAEGVGDHRPPVSVATVADGVLTVDAQDEGAGVRDVWASIDGGPPRRVERPLPIKDEQAVAVYATDYAGNVEHPHGPADAPAPAESMVSVSDEATLDVDFDRSRRVEVQTRAPWLSAELGDDGKLRLRVTREHVPDGEHAGLVRLAYADGAASASVAVAVE